MARIRYWFDIYRRAFGAYTPQLIVIIVTALFSSVLQGIGISAVIPVYSFATGTGGQATNGISQFIIAVFAFLHIAYTFRFLVVFIAVLFLLRTACIFFIRNITARIIYSYERDLRDSLFSKTLAANWPFLSQQQIGNLEQLVTTNTTNASQFFGNVSAAVIVISNILAYVGIAINLSWWVALLSLFSGGVVFLAVRPLFYRGRLVSFEAERTNRALAHFVSEHVIGMKAVKAMALEGPVAAKGRALFDRMRYLNMRNVILRSWVEVVVQFAAVGFVGLVFAVMYYSGQFSLAVFAVIVYAISQIFAQVQAGQLQFHTLSTMFPYIVEAVSYMKRTEDNAEAKGGGKPFVLERSLAFEDVSFSYPQRAEVLSHVSFEIPHGKLFAIVGPSGAGKTTVADLLLRLVEPIEGRITADGVDLNEISVAAWRGDIGYVPQDAVLLNDTIEANISFHDTKISHEGAVAAAKSAYIHDFVESLPEGYQTVIGDRGILLSGGQRQRIALARVLARKPKLLVLDEATSSLDGESERAIQVAVESLRGKVTVVIIAHRMTTVAAVDHVIVLNDGAVAEEGSPQELLKDPDSYFSHMMKAHSIQEGPSRRS